MKAIYDWLGISRQAYYQHQRRRVARQAMEKAVCEQVRQIRQRHPRMGTRKLWQELQPWLTAEGYKVGRDRLFDILRKHELLLKPHRPRRRTTWAGHWRCPNLLAEITVTRPNQAWVSDITYVETEPGFAYLCLVTDLFSRRIMGFDLSVSLAVEGALRALYMACRGAQGSLAGLIHHSDHGVQYTCHAYRQALAKRGMRSSMSEVGNCYDNAIAERINGILKLEYGLDNRFASLRQARQAVREAQWLYNHERPHLSLNYQKPHQVYINGVSYTVH
jgi:transposase InsO family protein